MSRKKAERNAERNTGILVAVMGGKTLDSVGVEHGLTRERVRSIVMAETRRRVEAAPNLAPLAKMSLRQLRSYSQRHKWWEAPNDCGL